MQKERCGDNRSRMLQRSCTHAGENPTKYKCFVIYGIFKREKFTDDI